MTSAERCFTQYQRTKQSNGRKSRKKVKDTLVPMVRNPTENKKLTAIIYTQRENLVQTHAGPMLLISVSVSLA